MSNRWMLRGGQVVTADGPVRADVAIEGETITQVGEVDAHRGDITVDATDRLILPGFVDAHSHADGLLGDHTVARALLRQGITTVITGQDGVSYAPGDGGYATDYFAAINGAYPPYRGGGVSAYLASIDASAYLNAGYLVPAGTARFEVCGRESRPASDSERQRMTSLVAQGMTDGALGLSTGLDYVPNLFQDVDELVELCVPVAASGGVYVSHLRGGYEANSAVGVAEMLEISERAGRAARAPLPVHVSHFHADADIVLRQLDELQSAGVAATFDAYPYIRGCTLLGMPLLPPEVSALPADEAVVLLSDPARRADLVPMGIGRATTSASLGPEWPDMITLAHLAEPGPVWALGHMLRAAAHRAGTTPMEFALDVLAATRLQCSAVMAVPNPRPATELARTFAHPGHMGGSDGIFIGGHPHPRAAGTFARYLRDYVLELGIWSWSDAVQHLSRLPAETFGLGRRGTIEAGSVADLVLVDPADVTDNASYDNPTRLASGIDDVWVAGVAVLADGELTGAKPGRGLRRDKRPPLIPPEPPSGHSPRSA